MSDAPSRDEVREALNHRDTPHLKTRCSQCLPSLDILARALRAQAGEPDTAYEDDEGHIRNRRGAAEHRESGGRVYPLVRRLYKLEES